MVEGLGGSPKLGCPYHKDYSIFGSLLGVPPCTETTRYICMYIRIHK